VKLIVLTEARKDEEGRYSGQTYCHVNVEDIAAVTTYVNRYHSFRPEQYIGEISLRSGRTIYVMESVEQIVAKIDTALGNKEKS
jgi:hypothetical protein